MSRTARFGRSIVIAVSLAVCLVGVAPAGAGSLTEGSPDPTFGLSGGVIDWRNGVAFTDVAVQPDGKVLATTDLGSVYRYTAQGTSDPSWADNGVLRLGTSSGDFASGIAIQPDGKIVVVANLNSADGELLRYLPNGKPDLTFADSGRRSIPVGVNGNSPAGVAIQPDGKIVVVGSASDNNYDQYVARFRPGGSLDSTFNPTGATPGVVVKDFSGQEAANAIALQPDGKILVTGWMFTGSNNDISLFRLTPTGALDSTFADDHSGLEVTPVGTGDDAGNAVTVAGDGHIYVAGSATWANPDAVVVRYTSAGSLDSGWGEAGHRAFNPMGIESFSGVAVQRNGKVLAGGVAYTNSSVYDFHMLLVRLNRDGSDDASLGTRRLYLIGNDYASAGAGLVLMRNGRIVLAGDGEIDGYIYPGVLRVLGDLTKPSAAAVTIGPRLKSGRRVISWHATDDNTGVHTYTVQLRWRRSSATKFGSWRTFRSATTAHKVTFSPTSGRRYCFRARARDWAGNLGPYGAGRCFSS
jgi:uncharacterized delta-60 repeat protein